MASWRIICGGRFTSGGMNGGSGGALALAHQLEQQQLEQQHALAQAAAEARGDWVSGDNPSRFLGLPVALAAAMHQSDLQASQLRAIRTQVEQTICVVVLAITSARASLAGGAIHLLLELVFVFL